MLYLTCKKANYLFLKKETVIALKMSTKRKIYYFVLLNYKIIFFFGIGSSTSTFYKNVQCYKILHPENETGFHNLWWIALKRSCLFLGLVVLVSVILQIIIRYNIYSKSAQSALSYFVIKLLKF